MRADFIATLVRLACGASVRWAGCAPDTRQRIYFANHTSHLDALLLWAVLPAPVRLLARPVAAHDYWTATRLRQFLAGQIFNAVLIERKKVTATTNPVEKMITGLGQRHSLILFPEGGRNLSSEPGPFKSGLYHLAKHRPAVDLVPVWIDNLNRVLPKGEFLPVPMLSGVTFGEPLRLREDEGKTDFLERTRRAVLSLRNDASAN